MVRKKIYLLLIFTLLFSATLVTAESNGQLRLASWNVRILSDSSRDDRELELIASILERYDLIAIQEVRDTRVLDRLERMMGPQWDYSVSEPAGRGVKELYAFFYRNEKVILTTPAHLILDNEDLFIREPAYAGFSSGNFDFVLVSMHALYGDSVNERREEIRLLDDLLVLFTGEEDTEKDIILLGDFNMDADDSSWELEGYTSLIPSSVKTTITDTSSYDNMWLHTTDTFEREFISLYEIYHFDRLLFENDDKAASLAVSDHRPISALFRTQFDDDPLPFDKQLIAFGTGDSAQPELVRDRVYISNVVTSPTALESVTLFNPTQTLVDLSGWVLGDKNDPGAFKIRSTSLEANTSIQFSSDTLPFRINNTGEEIYLFDEKGTLIDSWEDE